MMLRYTKAAILTLFAAALAFPVLPFAGSQEAYASAETARMADEFVDSIGVVTHGDYNDAYVNETMWLGKLQDLGIRHVREHILKDTAGNAAVNHGVLEDLYDAGITFDLIVDMRYGTITELLDAIKNDPKILAGTDYIEGPNEYDIRGVTNWDTILRDWQTNLYTAVKADPDLSSKGVIGPSIVKYSNPNNFQVLGDLDAYQDYGNIHGYPGGGNVPDFKINIKTPILRQYQISATKPVIVTESGYHNAIYNYPDGHKPASETAAAKLMPRLFLDTFSQGFTRTYAYELLDQHANTALDEKEDHFGMVRFDGTNKPSYTAIKNMISLLSDPGSSFSPGSLDYTLTGNTANVRHQLLQKRDGTFYLALWLNEKDFVPGISATDPGSDLTPAAQTVTVTLNQPSLFSKAETYLTNSSAATPTDTVNNPSSFNVDVPDEPLFIKLTPASELPDLIVTDVQMSPASPTAGDNVTFSATIKNQGTAATPAGTISGVRFQVDGTTVTWSDSYTSSIPAGSSVTVTANGGPNGSSVWTATGGSHNVEAYVDDINRMAESDETNNKLTEPFTVTTPLPDLIVTDISWSPADPVDGNAVTFSATIKNQGAGATPAGTISGVKFKVDGVSASFSDSYTSSIPAGASVTVTANGGGAGGGAAWTAAEGAHTVQAIVDDIDRMAESDETNNDDYSEPLTVAATQPDMVITNISWSPANPAPGDHVVFSATIKNQGTAATPSGTINSVTFKVDGTSQSWEANYTTPIAPGASVTVTANGGPDQNNYWTAASGIHTVLAVADDANRIAESDETNNADYIETMNIGTDLVITGITWTPASPANGNNVLFSATIKNQGTVATPSGTINSVTFKIDGTSVSWEANYTTSLGPGASVTVTANGGPGTNKYWAATSGTHTVQAVSDDVNRISETDETNNDDYSEQITVN